MNDSFYGTPGTRNWFPELGKGTLLDILGGFFHSNVKFATPYAAMLQAIAAAL